MLIEHTTLRNKKFIKKIKDKKADIIITSRFMNKNSLADWPALRNTLQNKILPSKAYVKY